MPKQSTHHVSRGKKTKYRIKPGASPGTVAVEPGGPRAEIFAVGFGPDTCEEKKIDDLAEIGAFKDAWSAVWIHMVGIKDITALNAVQKAFSLHSLALEDVVNQNQRPKMEAYDDHGYMVLFNAERQETLNTSQVNVFLGEHFVVTIVDQACSWVEPIRRRIREGDVRFKTFGAAYLAYAVIDATIDHYFPVLDGIAEQLETLESKALMSPGKSEIVSLHHLSGELLSLRRVLLPLKDLLGILVLRDSELIPHNVKIYFRDCADHTAQLLDEIDMDREIAQSLVDTTLSSMSNRMNEIMKVLTVISTIFIPLSFLAGVWGMNFDPAVSALNMPELRWRFGYPTALLLMASVSVGLLRYFSKKGWLGKNSRDDA